MSPRRSIGAAVLAALLVITGAVGLIVSWQDRTADRQLDRNRAAVAEQAGPLVAQLFSLTPADPSRQQARAAVTPEFAQQYAAVLGVEPAADVSIVWTPVHTGVAEVTEDRAAAVVSAQVTETAPGVEPITATKVVDVQLERSGDQWKIARADEVL